MAEHEVLVRIREMILTGRLPPGERVTEVGIAGTLKVSRTPVRAALPALAKQGLLTPVGRRGFAVTAFTADECMAALQIRSVLEGMAAHSVTMRGLDPELLATLKVQLAQGDALLAKRHVTPADEEVYGQMNARFHDAIVTAARVPLLLDLVHRVNLVPFVSPGAMAFSKLGLEHSYELMFYAHQQHHAIVQAMADGDSGRADSLFREHANSQRESMWQSVPRAVAVPEAHKL